MATKTNCSINRVESTMDTSLTTNLEEEEIATVIPAREEDTEVVVDSEVVEEAEEEDFNQITLIGMIRSSIRLPKLQRETMVGN